MKKILNYYLSITFIASLFVVGSCGTEEDQIIDGPTVTATVENNETTVNVGESVSFTVNVTAPAGFNTFIVNQTVGNNATVEFKRESRASGTTPTTHTYSFSFTPSVAHAGKEIVFDFIAVDDNNPPKEGKYTYTVVVNEQSLVEYQTVLLGGQANTTESSFYNALENVKYMYNDAKANPSKVDFLYHYGDTNLNIIASPDDADSRAAWADIYKLPLTGMDNATRFKRVTTKSYENINSSAAVVNAYTENANPELSRLTKLNQGEIFVFKLDGGRGGRFGVAKVVSVAGTSGANRTITLSVKIQAVNN